MSEIINEQKVERYIERMRKKLGLREVTASAMGWPKPFIPERDMAVADAPPAIKRLVGLWWAIRTQVHQVGMGSDEGVKLLTYALEVRLKTEHLVEQAWPNGRLRCNGKIVRIKKAPAPVPAGPDSR